MKFVVLLLKTPNVVFCRLSVENAGAMNLRVLLRASFVVEALKKDVRLTSQPCHILQHTFQWIVVVTIERYVVISYVRMLSISGYKLMFLILDDLSASSVLGSVLPARIRRISS